MPSSRASSRPGDQIHVSCIAGRFFINEPLGKPKDYLLWSCQTNSGGNLKSPFDQRWKKNFNTICNELEIADYIQIQHVLQFSSVAQPCMTLCDPMNHSTPGLPVHHHLPEFTQTHIYRVGDAIQPSHPLLSPSPPAPNPSQHQGLFQ